MKEGDLLKKFNIAARYSEHTPDTVKRPWLSGMVGTILQTSDHIYFGEPHVNGNFLKVYEMLAQNPEMFQAAGKAGVKHFALEFPEGMQKSLDQYAAGEMTRAQFHFALFESKYMRFATPWLSGDAEKQFRSNFIQAIDNAIEAGMKVHFADVSWQVMASPPPREIMALQRKLIALHRAEKSKLNGVDYMQQYIDKLPSVERDHYNKLLKDHERQMLKDRLDDSDQYDNLRLKVSPGERVMGVVGLGHLDNSVGNKLGINNQFKRDGESVATVEIYDGRNTKDFTTALQEEIRGIKNRDLPDYTIILGENAVLDKSMVEVDPATLKPPQAPPAAPKLAA